MLPPLSAIVKSYSLVCGLQGAGQVPMDLDHLGRRVIARAFKARGVEWKGWHAFRRGLASTLFELGCDDLTVQRILRHSKVSVTRAHYIRVRDPKIEDAMTRLADALNKQERSSG